MNAYSRPVNQCFIDGCKVQASYNGFCEEHRDKYERSLIEFNRQMRIDRVNRQVNTIIEQLRMYGAGLFDVIEEGEVPVPKRGNLNYK